MYQKNCFCWCYKQTNEVYMWNNVFNYSWHSLVKLNLVSLSRWSKQDKRVTTLMSLSISQTINKNKKHEKYGLKKICGVLRTMAVSEQCPNDRNSFSTYIVAKKIKFSCFLFFYWTSKRCKILFEATKKQKTKKIE